MLSGVTCILFSGFFFTIAGLCVKLATTIPSYEAAFFRSLIIFILSAGALALKQIPPLGNNRKILTLRGLTGAGALLLFFITVKTLPFAVAVTLQFLSPIFTVLISSLILKEPPTKLQTLALIGALAAVFLVQDIRLGDFSIFSTFGVLAAFLSALSYTSIRTLNHTEHPLVIVLYFALVTLILIAPYTMVNWVQPDLSELLILLVMGLAAQGAQYFLTLAYQREKAPLVANLTYLNIVWAMILGELIWGEHLSAKSYLGIVLIMICAVASRLAKRPTLDLSSK